MEATTVIILLLHPVAALIVIWQMIEQYRYRKLRIEKRSESTKQFRSEHEKKGERLFRWAFVVVALAFFARLYLGLGSGKGWMVILPDSVHGVLGLIGLVLLTFLVQKGRITKRLRENREKFTLEMQRHGRAADVIMVLMAIHAFLGFLYLLQLLVR